jgi:cobalt-zinc-cadmium efflux system membrane fusion protein
MLTIFLLASCTGNETADLNVGGVGEKQEDGELHLSDQKFKSLGIKLDTIPIRPLSGLVTANGQLEVPPQHEATVTAILGANVTSIQVIEGDKIEKGQVLATLAHPNFTQLQTAYVKAFYQMQFLEKEYNRQKKLYEESVGSGKVFQQTEADYQSIKGEVRGYEAQLKLLQMDPQKIRSGELYENIPVISPIDGYIEKVKIQIGQYVDPQKEMFMIVNIEHIHADLMVFEKDAHKVKKGQDILFTVESAPGITLSAKIYSVGKQFEQNPKAIHVHAEIEDKKDLLIPGMYINGRIHTEGELVNALPEEAIIERDGRDYVFSASSHEENGETEWEFKLIEVRTGLINDGWVEIKLLQPLAEGTLIAWDNAYYLISEMNKGETEHGH